MLTATDTLDTWLDRHMGLTLRNFPDVKGVRLRDHFATIPRELWDDHVMVAARMLSIPETHFARHPECFEALEDLLQDVARARPAGTIRLWSAGCATGEEAWQLAEIARRVCGDRVQVYGTDMSEAAVAIARQGRYRSWSMRGRAAKALDWLTTHPDGSVEVDPTLLPLVDFQVGNLADPAVVPGRIDVAFCRNVLIYFSADGGGRVLDTIRRSLRPGGLLLTAPTDPMFPAFASFQQVSRPGPPVRIYRRDPAAPDERPVPATSDNMPVDLAANVRRLLGS
jgi:chemotaxis methyl-accepting protein methylase